MQQNCKQPIFVEAKQHLLRFAVDTINASTAHAAIWHGATTINDISAGRHDAEMLKLLARHPHVQYVAMYSSNPSPPDVPVASILRSPSVV